MVSHLDHDISIHRNYYRLQDSTIELTKISKLLIAIDEGYAHRVAGKNLNTINEEIALSDLLINSESCQEDDKSGDNELDINEIALSDLYTNC